MKLFDESMADMSVESIASKLSFLYETAHLLHWQTTSYAEHQALGGLYDKLVDYKDDIVEKVMGYAGKRPVSVKVGDIKAVPANDLVNQVSEFASSLKKWAEPKGYHDICNIADALSGDAAKTRYLLTLQ